MSRWTRLPVGPGSIICSMLDVSAHDYFGEVCLDWKVIQENPKSFPSVFLVGSSDESVPVHDHELQISSKRFFELARKYSEAANKRKAPFLVVRLLDYTPIDWLMVTVQFMSKNLRILDITNPDTCAYETSPWYSFSDSIHLKELIVRDAIIAKPSQSMVGSIIRRAPNLKRVTFIRTDFYCENNSVINCESCHSSNCKTHNCGCDLVQRQMIITGDWCGHADAKAASECRGAKGITAEKTRCHHGLPLLLLRPEDKPLDSLTFRDCLAATPRFLTSVFQTYSLPVEEVNTYCTGKTFDACCHDPRPNRISLTYIRALHAYVNELLPVFSCPRVLLEKDILQAIDSTAQTPGFSIVIHGRRERIIPGSKSLPDHITFDENCVAWNPFL